MIQLIALIAIGAGASVLFGTSVSALGVLVGSPVKSSEDAPGVSEKEFQKRLSQDLDNAFAYSGGHGFVRPIIRSTSDHM